MALVRSAAAGTAGLAAVLFVAVQVTGAPELVRMPVAPHLLTAAAAAVAALLVLAGPRLRAPVRTGIGAVCAAVLAAGCLAAVPHTLLILVVWAGGLVTGGGGPFSVTPAWLVSAAYLAAVAAAVCVLRWTVVDRRRARGRCPACGRGDKDRLPPTGRQGEGALAWWIESFHLTGKNVTFIFSGRFPILQVVV